jgi:hypothetical protein
MIFGTDEQILNHFISQEQKRFSEEMNALADKPKLL